jgi:hypothetical protein
MAYGRERVPAPVFLYFLGGGGGGGGGGGCMDGCVCGLFGARGEGRKSVPPAVFSFWVW